ncbi:MAG: FAD-binding oxidoreductase [Catenulispora sp.]|nr:FAD-binding oxidoreductase [Catenulispora sp.]
MRVAIIGTGVLGACVGWNLARAGAQVTFIDAAQPGEGVSDWSFAWVNASNKTVTKAYFDLNVAGMAEHRKLAEDIGSDGWWHPTGHLRWVDDPVAQDTLMQLVDLLAGWDYRVEVTTGAEVRRRLEPALAVPDEAPVVLYPDEGWVHGRHLVERLVGRAAAAGAEHRFGVAARAIGTASDGSVQAVTLSDGTSVAVDAVVNAAGPDASPIAALLGRWLPMRQEPGAVARLRCGPVPIRRAMHAPHIEMRPNGDSSMVLHSREVDALIGTSADPSALLYEYACRVIPELGGGREQVMLTRVSNRPIPADGFPSVGAVPSVPGYFEAVSHSGITLGPVLGRLLATEILTGQRDALLAGFGAERFEL